MLATQNKMTSNMFVVVILLSVNLLNTHAEGNV